MTIREHWDGAYGVYCIVAGVLTCAVGVGHVALYVAVFRKEEQIQEQAAAIVPPVITLGSYDPDTHQQQHAEQQQHAGYVYDAAQDADMQAERDVRLAMQETLRRQAEAEARRQIEEEERQIQAELEQRAREEQQRKRAKEAARIQAEARAARKAEKVLTRDIVSFCCAVLACVCRARFSLFVSDLQVHAARGRRAAAS